MNRQGLIKLMSIVDGVEERIKPRKRYVLRGDEQPTPQETAAGRCFVRLPAKTATFEAWLAVYGPIKT